MKFKKTLIATSIALALAIPASAFAATSTSETASKIRGFFGIDTSKLTAEQQADLKDYAQKMADLQKSMLDKMVSNGAMTQADADAEKAEIDSRLASGEYLTGGGRGHDMKDMKDGGMDLSKLTDDQKNTLLGLEKEQLTLQKELAQILVDQKLITQAQADSIISRIDTQLAGLTTSNLSSCFRMNGQMEGLRMLQGVTLTDAQKAAVTAWAEKSAAVQKKIVALYKDAGVITQAQADTMNSQIDAKASDPLSAVKMDNGMMGKGNMQGGHKGNAGNIK
jgi:type IV pilus biogenesis protein CpaD/CtpE